MARLPSYRLLSRLLFSAIALFWVAMNALLWRSEFGGGREVGGTIPVALVWEKMLIAPDNSTLEINRHGKKIGFCRWMPNIGEELATGKTASDEPIEGMVKRLSGYSVDLEGNYAPEQSSLRLRFSAHAEFDTNRVWRAMSARVAYHKTTWDVEAKAGEESLLLKYQDASGHWERSFTFAELRQPERLFTELGFPLPPGILTLPGGLSPLNQENSGLAWQARNDTLKFGHSSMRVYKLQARWLDRWPIAIVTTRVGEILRAELPGELVFQNDTLLL